MLTLFYGTLRYLGLWCVILPFYLLEGGHVYALIQPYIYLMQAGISFICIFFFCKTLSPQTEERKLAFLEAGRASFVMNLIIPAILGIVHTCGLLTAGSEVIGHSFGASLVSIFHAPLIYFAYFKWADPNVVSRELQSSLNDLKVPVTRWKKWNYLLYTYYYVCIVIGALFSIGLLLAIIIGLVIELDPPQTTSYNYDRPHFSAPAAQAALSIAPLDPELKPVCVREDYTDEQRRKISILEYRQQRLMEINEVAGIDY